MTWLYLNGSERLPSEGQGFFKHAIIRPDAFHGDADAIDGGVVRQRRLDARLARRTENVLRNIRTI